jgi:transposase
VGQFLSSTCGVAVATGSGEGIVEAIIERCAGLDVHQATVVVCVLIGEAGRKPRREIRTFSTLTRDLEGLRDWLRELGVTHIGMESTGVYWKPVHAILEGHFELIVGNARHIRNGFGRRDPKRAQDRGEGRRVDRRPGPPRADQAELRAAAADLRTA